MTMKPEDVSLETGTREAITDWCDDREWEERDGALSIGVWNRLAKANRSLYAANIIAKMLAEDERGKMDASNDSAVSYEGLAATEREGLVLAMLELGDLAEEMLTEVRENNLGCCGTRRANA